MFVLCFFFVSFQSKIKINSRLCVFSRKKKTMSNSESNSRALELSHDRIMESGLKAYQNIQDEMKVNKDNWDALLKEKGFMGLILNDPKDVAQEKEFKRIQQTLEEKLKHEKSQRRAAQLSFVEFYKRRNRDIPINYEKYLWALQADERGTIANK